MVTINPFIDTDFISVILFVAFYLAIILFNGYYCLPYRTSYGAGKFETIWPMLANFFANDNYGNREVEKYFFGSPKILSTFVGPGGYEYIIGQGGGKKKLGPPIFFFPAPFLSTSLPPSLFPTAALFAPHFPFPVAATGATKAKLQATSLISKLIYSE